MIYAFCSFLLVFIIWAFVTYQGLISPFFLPSPQVVAQTLVDLFQNKNLLSDIEASFYRIGIGFILSILIALPLGVLFGINKKSHSFFVPLISFIRYIPVSALVPLFILWFGTGDLAKVLIILELCRLEQGSVTKSIWNILPKGYGRMKWMASYLLIPIL